MAEQTRPETIRTPAVARGPQLAAALVTGSLLAIVQAAVRRPMLLAERFLPGAGWAEVVLLAVYAGWVAGHLMDRRQVGVWRRRIWTLFSAVFFGQLLFGLAGAERFLMTGKLHLPIPALIVAGPLYRGEGVFMPILLAVTLLLVGPAWCSYLCYIGAWDLNFAKQRKKPAKMPRWRGWVRVGVLLAIAAVALGLRLLGVSGAVATGLGATFGLLGVGLMVFGSRRKGVMVHCTSFCPIGVIATVAGRLSPFRMRIKTGCSDCGACSFACPYDALRPEDIARRRPGLSCTLCGDCLKYCRGSFIEYRFLRLAPETARALFFVLVASLHAVFLGVARI